MGKSYTYLWVMGGLVILFYISGITGTLSPDNPSFLDILVNWKDIDTSMLVTGKLGFLFALSALGTAGLIYIGFGSTILEKAAIYGFTTLMLAFGWDFLAVAKAVANECEVCSWIATLLFAPFMVMFVISLIDWWRGDYT